jgi:hypothetical protein
LVRDEQGVEKAPLHMTAAMGLAPSAGWAQGLTDATAKAAAVPPQSRVTFDHPCPLSLPVWGCIIDDFWAIDEQPPKQKEGNGWKKPKQG